MNHSAKALCRNWLTHSSSFVKKLLVKKRRRELIRLRHETRTNQQAFQHPSSQVWSDGLFSDALFCRFTSGIKYGPFMSCLQRRPQS